MGIKDYQGRTVDLLAYQGGVTSGGSVLLSQHLATTTNSGLVTTGIQKLAQRFILELLTEKGTLRYQPTRGTDFMRDARLGVLQSALDVLASFSAALVDVKNNLVAEEESSDPLDERFFSAEALNVFYTGDTAGLLIQVVSLDGQNRKVIAPLNVVV